MGGLWAHSRLPLSYQSFDYVGCNIIKHISNSAADWVAKQGLGSKTILSWSICLRPWLEHDLSYDVAVLEQHSWLA